MRAVSFDIECTCGERMLITDIVFSPNEEEEDVAIVFEGYCSVCGKELSHSSGLRDILSTEPRDCPGTVQ